MEIDVCIVTINVFLYKVLNAPVPLKYLNPFTAIYTFVVGVNPVQCNALSLGSVLKQ